MVLQWSDEDRGLDGFYTARRGGEALSYYHRKDGKVVGLWKWSLCGLSEDEGASFSKAVKAPTLIMDGGKVWGQRTDDDRYALVYNPTKYGEHRYPLAVVSGDDGITFDTMLVVHGEVPPRRFFGRWKDYGPQYVRGIAEGNGNPPGDDLWVTYSINKEDMWVSKVPVPIRYAVSDAVNDTFDDMDTDGIIKDWNIYSPIWAPVAVVAYTDNTNKVLELRDADPYDYAKAVRVFQEGDVIEATFRVLAKQADQGSLEIELLDKKGNRPVRVWFSDEGKIKVQDTHEILEIGEYNANTWNAIAISADTTTQKYTVSMNGNALTHAVFAEPASTLERLSFRTGPYRDHPTRQTVNEEYHDPLPHADEQNPVTIYHIDDVIVQ
jgi:hypothetical protein